MNEFLYNVLAWINGWVGSWGWAMVIFTIMIRLVLTPLDLKSRISMRKTSKLQPKMAELQKKYANDKEKLNAKTAELYKKEGVNPLSSCLPLLLTWPILIIVFNAMRMASNRALLDQITQIVRNEPVTMEPWLWIKNLWMPDSFFSPALPDLGTMRQIPTDMWSQWFSKFNGDLPQMLAGLNLTADSFANANLSNTIQSIYTAMTDATTGNAAYISAITPNNSLSFNLLITKLTVVKQYNGWMLLPILSAATQILMTKITGAGQQPQGNDQAATTGKFMQWFFPIFSLVICFGYSSAFALYWVAGNVVSMVQTVVINKVLDSKEQQTKIAGEGTVK